MVLAWAGTAGTPAFERGHVLPPGMATGARAVALGRAVWTPDVLTDPAIVLSPDLRRLTEATKDRAVLAVPLKARGAAIGAVIIAYPVGRVLREDEVQLAEAFSDQIALALENARLFAETRGRLAESETLLAVAGILSQPVPNKEAMRRVAREVARALGADMSGIYFLDAVRQALRPVAGYHVPTHLLPAFLETPFPLSAFGETVAERGPIWTSDYLADPRFDFPFMTAIEPGAVLFAPTLVRGEMVGAIFLVWWARGRAFDPSELRLLEGVASQVGLAAENAELARQTAEKLDEMERLLSVSRALSSTIELGPLLRTLLEQVTRTAGADSAGVWLADPASGELEPFAGYHVTPELVERLRHFRIDPGQSRLYTQAIARRAVVTSPDAPNDEGLPPGLVSLAPHRAQLFAPIVANERLVGAIIVVWWERELTCGARDLALVHAMASQAAIASRARAPVRGRPAEAGGAVRAVRALPGSDGPAGHDAARRGRAPRGGAGAGRAEPGHLLLRSRPSRAGDRPPGVGRDPRGRSSAAARPRDRARDGRRDPAGAAAHRRLRRGVRARGRRPGARGPRPAALARRADRGRRRRAGRPDPRGRRSPVHGGRRAPARPTSRASRRWRSGARGSTRSARRRTAS